MILDYFNGVVSLKCYYDQNLMSSLSQKRFLFSLSEVAVPGSVMTEWRPLSENIELENVGFSRPPLQIYVPVTKLLFSDCDVIF